jgi:hypothetical protein
MHPANGWSILGNAFERYFKKMNVLTWLSGGKSNKISFSTPGLDARNTWVKVIKRG